MNVSTMLFCLLGEKKLVFLLLSAENKAQIEDQTFVVRVFTFWSLGPESLLSLMNTVKVIFVILSA